MGRNSRGTRGPSTGLFVSFDSSIQDDWFAYEGLYLCRNEKKTTENMAAGSIQFSDEELKELNELVDSFEVKGGRYPEAYAKSLWG
jgi:hypothetical protein